MTGSTYQLNDDEIQYLSLLLDTIDSQNWKAFAYTILNDPALYQSYARKISQSVELNGMTILHACVRHNPPPNIIKLLVELVPESPSCADCLFRTPLHVAAGTRASLPIIKILSESFPGACDMQDEDGKTPLHLACDSACELFEGDGELTRDPPSYEVVRKLIKVSPLSVPLEDQDGMSALEHAIFSDASVKVVKLLQHVTRKQCETQQKRRLSQEWEVQGEQPNVNRPKLESSLERLDIDVQVQQHTMMNTSELETVTATVIPAMKGEFSRRRGAVRRVGNLMHV